MIQAEGMDDKRMDGCKCKWTERRADGDRLSMRQARGKLPNDDRQTM